MEGHSLDFLFLSILILVVTELPAFLTDASPLPYSTMRPSRQSVSGAQQQYPNIIPGPHDDVLAELRHCSAKSSKAVQNCYKTYETDVSQFGRKGEPCCAQAKFVNCLHESLILPCNKYVDRLVKLYIKDRPAECSKISYPSMSCIVIVNTNTILVVSIAILVITVCCGLVHLCKCVVRCCRPCCPRGGRSVTASDS